MTGSVRGTEAETGKETETARGMDEATAGANTGRKGGRLKRMKRMKRMMRVLKKKVMKKEEKDNLAKLTRLACEGGGGEKGGR